MMERYAVTAGRIRQELIDIEKVVAQAERAMTRTQQHPEDLDLYLDSAALNLHDFYAGLERIFQQIATSVDRSLPSGQDWHRELLRQMTLDLPKVRPQVLSKETIKTIDEFLRFRHVVRNIYTFEFDAERIEKLVQNLRSAFNQTRTELLAFADFLNKLVQED